MSGQTVNGLQWGAGITQTRTYNNVIINTYNPYYQATLNLSVTQPLLKNAGMNPVKHQLKLAMMGADSDEAQALIDASTTIAQVEDAYWDLVAAWRNVAIQEDALHQAVVQQQSVVRLAKRGAVARITVIESETQVANFQASVFSALQTVSELRPSSRSHSRRFRRSALARESGPVVARAGAADGGDLAEIVALAEKQRPEVRQVVDERRVADLDMVFAKNQALPQAD